MKSTEQILKIKATVLYVLSHSPQGMDYIHLFKIMYFAQQRHLVTYGSPLMEDTFMALKHGPVPSLTYKVIRASEQNGHFDETVMQDFCTSLTVKNVDGRPIVYAAADCDLEEFSKSDIAVLDACIKDYWSVGSFDLSDLSHDLAWKRARRTAERTGESAKLPLFDIAEAGGASKGMLQVIRERQWTVTWIAECCLHSPWTNC